MGLVLEMAIRKGIISREDIINIYLNVPKTHLSEPYELPGKTAIIGEILDIKSMKAKLTEEEAKIEEVIGKEIRFILFKNILGFYDTLYISKGSWPILRDYGILPDEYILKVKVDEEVMSEITRRRLADYYYDNFRKYYEAKKFSKSSEFLWGALNALVYAIGLLYGKKVGKHKEVVDFVTELANAHEDKEMGELLSSAQTLHANFYHDFMDELMFEDDRQKTEKLLEKLVKILDKEIQKKGLSSKSLPTPTSI